MLRSVLFTGCRPRSWHSKQFRPGLARLVSLLGPSLATHPRNASVSPLPATLTKMPVPKSFVCHLRKIPRGTLPHSLSSRNETCCPPWLFPASSYSNFSQLDLPLPSPRCYHRNDHHEVFFLLLAALHSPLRGFRRPRTSRSIQLNRSLLSGKTENRSRKTF
jgi:hypothetical protein